MSHIFHRNPKEPLPVAVGGKGIRLFDTEGRGYIDASGGAAVSCLGHGHPAVIEAIKRQADTMAYAHSSFFTTQVAEELADFLATEAPGELNHVYFLSGGSEAMEAALKMVRQYHVEAGEPSRKHFITRRQSYHGNTLGVLAIGGNVWRRQPFLPLLVDSHHVSPCYAYRNQLTEESEEQYADRLADELEAKIMELGAGNVAAFVAETVVGATAGVLPPVKTYFKKIREVCDKHGVLLILDEVMCGMGRTGHLFACAEENVVPDVVAIAKGLGGGYQPIGATLCTSHIYNTIVNGSGFFQHGHTYMGHAVACAASLAVMKTIREQKLLEKVLARGGQLRHELRTALANQPHIGDIRGRGLFVGIELVQNRQTKEPINPAQKTHAKIKVSAKKNGLLVYPMGGTIDGKHGDHILLAPPFICTESDISEIVSRLVESINQVFDKNS